ncbi:hypothetical protein U1Q18_034440 [Sarracenia purpurea var. burkii]
MESFGPPRFGGIGNTTRKKRSQASRRPRPESQQFPESRDHSPLSSTSPSDDASKVSSDENTGVGINSRSKVFNLNQCAWRGTTKKIKEDGSSSLSYGNEGFGDSLDQRGGGLNPSEVVSAPSNWENTNKVKGSFHLQSKTTDIRGGRNGESQSSGYSRLNGHGVGNDKLKRVKLKVGGVTRTIQTKSVSHGALGSGSSTKSSRTSDTPGPHRRMILQDNSDDDHSPPYKKILMQGIPWKDFSSDSSTRRKKDSLMGKMPENNASGNQGENLEPVRKSKRVPKRRVLDGAFDGEEEDDEIRYLEKLRISKVALGSKDLEEESFKKRQQIYRVSKKSRSERGSEDTDYEEEEDLVSDGKPNDKKKLRYDSIDSPIESKRELALTTRQRALLSSKDASSVSGASAVAFPNGLPPAPPRS